MSNIDAGTKVSLTKWMFKVYWPTMGDSADFRLQSKIGSWIGQNEKTLNKKKAVDISRLIHDEFGAVSAVLVEERGGFGQAAWLRGEQ